ncbi:MAG3090 family protein [Mycoplasmopsis gallopavonis]|uniref:Uncharacterized protein n=1 Tax=Mycoplasmopsis gallopavonis TaxID=76629 RepID=A0A449B0B7_9BACT|nr:hypothetical protein [Mycoplasmopsis gallopavonis]RIV16342.1 hypothetical protein D1113_02750 [Mycoplasmopsis gallopavonis]VEU73167.1 Uncharacterised protein [Mycoplasmopsis gallopavonis]
MKRLQCLYKPNKDKNYPWALKHPKVDSALAVFKTRKDAMTWFLSLGYDCATWFQNDRKVWGGLLIAEKNPQGVMEYELNVDKFDGKLNYEETLAELNILESGFRNDKDAAESLSQVTDYKVLNDHNTYFPVDDDIIIERKKSKKDLEIEELKAKILELSALLSSSNSDFSNELNELMEQLQDSNSDKELLRRQIEILKARQEAAAQAEKEVIVEKPTEKIVEKEVVREVVKEVYVPEQKVVKYENFDDLCDKNKLKAVALYSKKVESFVEQLQDKTVTSKEDFNKIQNNLNHVFKQTKLLEEKLQDKDDMKKIAKLSLFSLSRSLEKLNDKLVGSNDIKETPATAVYVMENDENIRLAQATSFVSFDYKHVGFVPEKDYAYAIFTNNVDNSKFLVFDWPVETSSKSQEVVKVVETEVVEKQPTEWWVKALVIFILTFCFAVLATLVFCLGWPFI